jgi:hypothetical protein
MPMSSDIKRLLAQADWKKETQIGRAQARKIELKYKWAFPASIAAEVVNDAIAKTLSGERVWDPNKVGLRRFLFGVIRSLYSNKIRKALQTPQIEEYDDERGLSYTPSVEEAVEMESHFRKIIQTLHLEEPSLYSFLYQCAEYGLFDGRESKDVAADMNMLAPNFSKKKKRLVEFLTELQAEISSFGT